MSKFDYDNFCGDYCCIGFNASKYTKEKALEIGAQEYGCSVDELCIEEAYIYYGFGYNGDEEWKSGYWLCDCPTGNSFKAWSVFEK